MLISWGKFLYWSEPESVVTYTACLILVLWPCEKIHVNVRTAFDDYITTATTAVPARSSAWENVTNERWLSPLGSLNIILFRKIVQVHGIFPFSLQFVPYRAAFLILLNVQWFFFFLLWKFTTIHNKVKVTQLCPTVWDQWTVACQAPLSMEFSKARILKWVTIPFFKESSQPRDQTQVSHILGGFFTIWATREAQEYWSGLSIPSPGDLPEPGIQRGPPALQVDSYQLSYQGR